MSRTLTPASLRWQCPGEWLTGASTADIEPSVGIIGQDRAVRALEFGLAMDSLGFNVFLTGLTGTGKMTAVEVHLRPLAGAGPRPDDLLFTFNPTAPERPRLLRLGAGRGVVLRDRLCRFARDLRKALPNLLQGEEFQKRLEEAVEELKHRQQELMRTFEQRVRQAGFALVQVQIGPVTRPEVVPVLNGKPVPLEQVRLLQGEDAQDAEQLGRLEQQYEELSEELQRAFQEMAQLREEMNSRAARVRADAVRPLLHEGLTEIARAVQDPRVQPFLDGVQEDMLTQLDLFGEEGDEDALVRYQVNVLVDNGATTGRPLIIETEPTFQKMFGAVEARLSGDGQVGTDHTRIRAGSLLRANGGFLVVNAFDVVAEDGVWPALKRALRYRRVVIQPREGPVAVVAQAVHPEPVELDVKVVMVGDRSLFDLLHQLDEDFRKIFKVLADFDSEMPLGRAEVGSVLSLMAKIVRDEDLVHLDRGGLAALVEETVRLNRGRRRLSTRFSDVADVMREASYLARRQGDAMVSAETIRTAVACRVERHSLPAERLARLIDERVLVVETTGAVVGQVNGLVVYDLGYYAFGTPSRVTAQVGLGRQGVISIERESRLSGRIHDKGVLILSGYLRGTLGLDQPLAMNASIAFEQSYGGVDGDSASSTEIYAILSALSGVPVRQDLAVTGSMDQQGRIQAIGGVNEKIEGFFEICRQRGLSGAQGVLIPMANVDDLQLGQELVAAVAAGSFHIIAVETVAEGVELLTGVPAGERDAQGAYPAGSILGLCTARLRDMAERLRPFREPLD